MIIQIGHAEIVEAIHVFLAAKAGVGRRFAPDAVFFNVTNGSEEPMRLVDSAHLSADITMKDLDEEDEDDGN